MSDTQDTVQRLGDTSVVLRDKGYHQHLIGTASCEVVDTGSGFIAKFPAHNSITQDYYVCLDYAQAHRLILGLSAFKKELGFA